MYKFLFYFIGLLVIVDKQFIIKLRFREKIKNLLETLMIYQ